MTGSDEVLDASRASGPTMPATLAKVSRLRSRSSKTASMTTSQPASPDRSSVGVIRARCASRLSALLRPRETALSSSLREYALPRSAASRLTSTNTTSSPTLAQAYAMPAPIMPAPITPTRLAEVAGTSLGREPPRLRWLRSKKNALVMLRCTGEPTSEANQRPSMAIAVSKSTEAPSTTAHRMAWAAG